MLWRLGALVGSVEILFLGGWVFYRWEYPYWYNHSCDKTLEMALLSAMPRSWKKQRGPKTNGSHQS
jgi:hypothetical protein